MSILIPYLPQNKLPLVIDTDPGIDDACALVSALLSPALYPLLVTTVAGNVNVDKTTENASKLINFMHKIAHTRLVPLAQGAHQPLIEPYEDASFIHGKSGLDGFDFSAYQEDIVPSLLPCGAIEALREVLDEAPAPVTVCTLGPLTNIALLMRAYPELMPKISRIVCMGAALGAGNRTPYAEFNIACDPEAAHIVFSSGVAIDIVPLEIGNKGYLKPLFFNKMEQFNEVSAMLHALLQEYHKNYARATLPIYDLHVIASVLRPDMYTFRPASVDVELNGTFTRGATSFHLLDEEEAPSSPARVLDEGEAPKTPSHVRVCVDVDVDEFNTWFIDSLRMS